VTKGTQYAYAAEIYDHNTYNPYQYDQPYYEYHDYSAISPWYIDSGATSHIASDVNKLDYPPTQSSYHSNVKTGGGESHAVRGTGTSTLQTDSGEIKLENVCYVPSLKKNLASVGSMTDLGHIVMFTKESCWIYKHNQLVATGSRDLSNGLYYLHETSSQALSVESSDIADLWHRRMGHISYSGLSFLSKSLHTLGLPLINVDSRLCSCCLAGKHHRERFPRKSERRAQVPGERIHTDVIGPMQRPSLGGSRFILVFTDCFSRKSWTLFMKHKSETFYHFRNFKAKLEAETGNQLKSLRSDRGGEYLSFSFNDFCLQHGIHRELTQPRTPQQNGVAERRNRTIFERARSIAADCKLPTFLWAEAISMATYLVNLSPTRANFGVPPEASYTGKQIKLDHLKIFGCMAYVHIPQEERQKLDTRTRKCMFVGYDTQSKAFRLYDPIRRKIVISRDVVFDEDHVGYQHLQTSTTTDAIPSFSVAIPLSGTDHSNDDGHVVNQEPSFTQPQSPVFQHLGLETPPPHDSPITTRSILTIPIADRAHATNLASRPVYRQISHAIEGLAEEPATIRLISLPPPQGDNHHPADEDRRSSHERTSSSTHQAAGPGPQPLPPPPIQSRRYPSRNRQPSQRLQDFWTFNTELTEEPINYQEAITHTGWKNAIDSEVQSILKNKTWDVIDRPPDRKPISAKWIFKVKQNNDTTKLKARIVARGFQQREGVDYQDIFAPVVRWSTIRIILALAAKNKWDLHQMDVITAFLNGTINEDVLMEIPEGFPEFGNPTRVCRIKRALYGLKQAPKAWYSRIDAWLTSQGYTRSKYDPNLYFATKDGKRVFILLYVDDLLITGDDKERIAQLKAALKQEFAMTDLGHAKQYLGAEILRFPHGILITQSAYIRKLLQRFGMENCNMSQLPMDPNVQLQKHMGTDTVNPELYRSLVGSLIYLTNTRIDISYAVGCVARYMDFPEVAHLNAAKRILRYLNGTINHGLFMSSDNNEEYHAYADADWGRDLDTRRSTSGILHKLGNSCFFWSSKLQPTVSLSTTEAEYRVLTDASKDVLYFRRLLTELGINMEKPTTLLSDNQSCLKLVQNPVMHARTKHIGIQHHFIRETTQSGDVHVLFTPTCSQQADFLTKPLPYTKFYINKQGAGILATTGCPNSATNLKKTLSANNAKSEGGC
jgi:histone deacetylase 1/2